MTGHTLSFTYLKGYFIFYSEIFLANLNLKYQNIRFVLFQLIFVLFFGFTSLQLFGQTENINFRHFNKEEGFYGKTVKCLYQDHLDYMWIGTDEGLYRYDGYSFKLFISQNRDSTTIGNNRINVIHEDAYGNLWIGTWQGLNLFVRETQSFLRLFPHDSNSYHLSKINVSYMFNDNSGNMWIGTNSSEVISVNHKFLERLKLNFDDRIYFTSPNDGEIFLGEADKMGMINNVITFIDQDKSGNLMVGLQTGLHIYSTNDFTKIKTISFSGNNGDEPNQLINHIACDINGSFWLGSHTGGFYNFDIQSGKFKQYNLSSEKDGQNEPKIIRSIYEGPTGNIWVGTELNGLYLLSGDGQVLNHYMANSGLDNSLSNKTIFCVYEDRFKGLWVGTWNGLNKGMINNKSFQTFRIYPEDMVKKEVKALYKDDKNNAWIATDNGLFIYNLQKRDIIKSFLYNKNNINGLSHFVVNDIRKGPDGNIYVATFGGIDIFDEKMNIIRHIKMNNPNGISISNNMVDAIVFDDHILWVATFFGLNKIDLVTGKVEVSLPDWDFPDNPKTISSSTIYSLFIDTHKHLWVGTSYGLNLYNNKDNSFESFTTIAEDTTSISNNVIYDIYEYGKDNLWIGTANGINLYIPETNTFKRYMVDCIPNQEITSIIDDEEGNLWLGTKYKLIKFNPSNETIQSYDKNDGIINNQFIQGAAYKNDDQQLYFGTGDGILIFDPAKITPDTIRPRVVITDFKILNKSVKPGEKIHKKVKLHKAIELTDTIQLYPKDNIISIEYAALHFVAPENNIYKYKLENFDQDWIQTNASRRYVSYSNLPGGSYIFRVKASNYDNVWNETGARLVLIVHPPFWATTWFLILSFVFLLSIFGLVHYLRSESIRKQNKLLEEKIWERTRQVEVQKSELEEQNKEIQAQNEEIQAQNEDLYTKNEEISAQQEQLSFKAIMLEQAHTEIKKSNAELQQINDNLEQIISKRTEELQKTIEQLTTIDNELNTFLYRSSHDLRGPLTTLIGLTSLAELENNDKYLNHYFKSIRSTSEQMLRTLRKLNDVNTVFRGNTDFSCVSWESMIESISSELEKIDSDNMVEKSFDITIDEPILCDENLLKIVILYIMENSVVFRKNHVKSFVKLKASEQKGILYIKIEDNGSGIHPSIQPKIFNMFFRGSESSKGNGLGLYLARKALDVLQGTCHVESEPDLYCTFNIQIPILPCQDN